jgi:hypothetical protein
MLGPVMTTAGRKDAMEPGFPLSQIDTSTAHPARIYDYLLGGKTNYPVDREAAGRVLRAAPEVRDSAHANRAFMRRVVRYLAGEAGIRQVIDIGTGIPTPPNVHQVAAGVAPDTRVAYVDNNTIAHAYANALLAGGGTTGVVLADLRDPEDVLRQVSDGKLIDLTRPAAVLLVAVVHFLTDAEDPAGIIATFRGALAPGSYLALSHATGDFRPDAARNAAAVYDDATSALTLRSRAEVTALFDGWDLVEPGVVQVPLWHPEGRPPRPRELARAWVYGGVARKGGITGND